MTLLLIANLGYAWGGDAAPPATGARDKGPHKGWYIKVRRGR